MGNASFPNSTVVGAIPFAKWNNRKATSLRAAPTRAKALRIKPPRTSALTAGFCERLTGHLSVRREGHFEFNATECGSGVGWPLKNVAWMSLGAMGSAAKAVLAWKSIVATRNGSARIEPRGDDGGTPGYNQMLERD